MQSFLDGVVAVFTAALAAEPSVAVLDGPKVPPPAEALMVGVGVSWTDREAPITSVETDTGAASVDEAVTVRCVLSRREPSGLPVGEVRGRALANLASLSDAVQADQTVGRTCGVARVGGTTRVWQGRDERSTWCDLAFEVHAVIFR